MNHAVRIAGSLTKLLLEKNVAVCLEFAWQRADIAKS